MSQFNCRALVLLVFLVPIASADDFFPPPWLRTDPSAITAEWEFFTPANPAAPDGTLTNVGMKGGGSVPSLAFITGSPAGLGWGMGDGDGGWFFPDGGDIRFVLDNVVHPRPVKHIRMQVTHTPGLGVAVDPMGLINFGATGSVPNPVTMTPIDGIHTLFTWDMFPNPPFEEFRLRVFGTGEIDQVVVDTLCVPEPATMGVLAMGMGALVMRRSRR